MNSGKMSKTLKAMKTRKQGKWYVSYIDEEERKV